MADFCYECTEELFGNGANNDFVGLLTPEEAKEGYMALVICEGCGPIQVDNLGHCCSEDCDGSHRKQTVATDASDVLAKFDLLRTPEEKAACLFDIKAAVLSGKMTRPSWWYSKRNRLNWLGDTGEFLLGFDLGGF